MSKEYLEAFGLVKRTCELYIETTRFLKGSDIIANQIKEALNTIQNRLESIDNSNPSEALESFDYIVRNLEAVVDDVVYMDCIEHLTTIKQALLKAQEPKQYLTWETLPFKKKSPECPRGIVRLNAKMGNTPLKVFCSYNKDGIHHYVEIYRVINDTLYIFMNLLDDENDEEYKLEPQLFNDLHLERVEE